MLKKLFATTLLVLILVVTGCSSEEATTEEVKDQYTMGEVNGKAVEVLQGLYAVEIKRENIPEVTKTAVVTLNVDGQLIKLKYHQERDSFRNSKIKDVELEHLEEGAVLVER